MRKQLLSTIMACGACLAWGAQAQSSSDPATGSQGSQSTYPSTTPGASSSSSSQSGWSERHISATGRMGHEAVRGSQLTGAQVTGSSGNELGSISDTIINPASGRLEFAVLSLSGNSAGTTSGTAGTSSTSGTSSTTPGGISSSSGTSASGLASAGKQVAVPWMLLRPSSSASAGSSSTSSTGIGSSTSTAQQLSFVFTGDASKLESAPNFDANTDLSQPSWRQSVFSYFGLSGRGFGGLGGAESPGGTSSGTQTPDGSSSKP